MGSFINSTLTTSSLLFFAAACNGVHPSYKNTQDIIVYMLLQQYDAYCVLLILLYPVVVFLLIFKGHKLWNYMHLLRQHEYEKLG